MPAIARPLLARTTFHGGTTSYSWLLAGLGAGAVAGGLHAARYARTGADRLARSCVYFALSVGFVAVAPTRPVAVAACVLAGAASIAFLTTGNSTIQLASEAGYRGRVTALWSMALVGTTPIGSPIIGALSDLAGPRWALGLGAAACVAAAVAGYWPARGSRPAAGRFARGALHRERERPRQGSDDDPVARAETSPGCAPFRLAAVPTRGCRTAIG